MVAITATATIASVPASAPAPPLGAYTPIKDVKDPHVQDIGKYAVEEYKKQQSIKSIFEFREVVSGEIAVVAGTKYRLIILVRSGGLLLKYQAIVWEKEWEHFRKLLSFKLHQH